MRSIVGTVVGYILASLYFLALIAFGTALATSPIHSTIKGWHERSDLENTFRVAASAICLLLGLEIVLGALGTGIVFPPHP
jgi:hypothetical protein